MTQSVTADTNKILTSNDNKKCLRKQEKQTTLPDRKNCGCKITRHRNSSRNAAMPAENEENFPILPSSANA
jgi:hypothetical protein